MTTILSNHSHHHHHNKTGIIGDPKDLWELGTYSTQHYGWEFKVKNKDLKLTKLRWFNGAEYHLARRVVLYDWPGGNVLTYLDIEASPGDWGSDDVNKEIILKANSTYRIFVKVPTVIPYFFTNYKNIKFNEKDIEFKSCRFTDDFVQVFETSNLAEFADFEYKTLN